MLIVPRQPKSRPNRHRTALFRSRRVTQAVNRMNRRPGENYQCSSTSLSGCELQESDEAD